MATFTKNGETRTVSTPAAAVRLRFNGWRETSSLVAATPPPVTDPVVTLPPKDPEPAMAPASPAAPAPTPKTRRARKPRAAAK